MPVVARFRGIVIRLLTLGRLGTHLHAFFGNRELVIDLIELRVLQGDLPGSREGEVLAWAREHRQALFARWSRPRRLTPHQAQS